MENLKERVAAYIDKWQQDGGRTGQYICPKCGGLLTTTLPDKKGEVWDSVVTCYECNDVHFITKTIKDIHVRN